MARLCRSEARSGYGDFVTDAPSDRFGDVLHAERRRVATQIDALQEQFDAIVEASRDTAADDEHDPDGATVGFERAQVAALLERAQARLVELDEALTRLERGEFGACNECGRPITPERLAALPTALHCVDCASGLRRR
jgi:DnaK suppressor protein